MQDILRHARLKILLKASFVGFLLRQLLAYCLINRVSGFCVRGFGASKVCLKYNIGPRNIEVVDPIIRSFLLLVLVFPLPLGAWVVVLIFPMEATLASRVSAMALRSALLSDACAAALVRLPLLLMLEP